MCAIIFLGPSEEGSDKKGGVDRDDGQRENEKEGRRGHRKESESMNPSTGKFCA